MFPPAGVIEQQSNILGNPFVSHTWTGAGSNVGLASRVGYQFTVGGENLTVNTLWIYTGNPSGSTLNRVMIHRVSDGAVISQADITRVYLSTEEATVTEFVLVAGTAYTISERNTTGGDAKNRNPTTLSIYAGITKTANVFNNGDDTLPTSISGNVYYEAGFGYIA